MTNQHLSEEAIFLAALDKATRRERVAYVAVACADNDALRCRVMELLASHDATRGPLDAPPAGLGATTGQSFAEQPGTMIGPYKLLQVIGEGGMGVVYMAEQTEPVERQVALKIIKPGMDSRQVIARFDAEKQALSLMDHVNIARVLDAGVTESGHPYFVMELVNGVPITKYCDDNRLTPRERLELFVPVCRAIQHAHQKGIIHRDIKPSNVMVTLYDGQPVPKVIDFGVAKATEQRLTERTLFTQHGTMVGTLEYMSPEQAEMSAQGVDTRSDIYSLGVVLYELLTGGTPLSNRRVRDVAYGEVLRMIKEEEPPKPSTRLSDSGEALASISAQRQMEPAKLAKMIRGELDWVVMKTLEKDRNRRYETASAFAADVQRYLNDEPVQACPPSAVYRFRKFVRRNMGAVLAASLVAVALVGGVIGTTFGLIQAEGARRAEVKERQRAEANEQKAVAAAAAEKKSKETALAREAETRAVLDFVQDKIFAAARPVGDAGGLGREVTLRKAVEAALPFVAASFTDQPLIEARLRMSLGASFLFLGDAKTAAEQFDAARALYTQHRGGEHADTLSSMNNLANSYAALGRYTDALKLREETLSLMKAKLGPDHLDTVGLMHNLAISYAAIGRHAEALKLSEETLALRKAKLGPDHRDTLASKSNLAFSYSKLGRYADALKLNEETLTLLKARLGPVHADTLTGMNSLAISHYELGRHADALKLFEETLSLRKAKLGPDHPDTLSSMSNLANTYAALGRVAEALQLHEETLALQKAKLGLDHPDTLASMSNLANRYNDVDRYTDALLIHEETLSLRKAKFGPNHPDTLTSMNNLAVTYNALGRNADALRLEEETLALMKANLGADHPETLSTMSNLAISYFTLARHADALKLFEETLALMKAKLGADHPDTLQSMNNLATCYVQLGRQTDSLKFFEETLALQKAKLGPDHPYTLQSMGSVAEILIKVDRSAQAVPIIDECIRLATGKIVDPSLIPSVMDLRLRHFEKIRDAAGCLETAGMWDDLKRADAASLYNSACFRAVGAAVIKDTDKSAGEVKAKEQADQAMAWLTKAAAAGFKDAAHIQKDKDLDALRDREDFQKLITELNGSP